jgi:hypothetical protein
MNKRVWLRPASFPLRTQLRIGADKVNRACSTCLQNCSKYCSPEYTTTDPKTGITGQSGLNKCLENCDICSKANTDAFSCSDYTG